MKVKTDPKDSKALKTVAFLINHDQPVLALKLLIIEYKRLSINSMGRKLMELQERNIVKYNSLKIDIDHFLLIHNEKG